jgi:hypothetical protein
LFFHIDENNITVSFLSLAGRLQETKFGAKYIGCHSSLWTSQVMGLLDREDEKKTLKFNGQYECRVLGVL